MIESYLLELIPALSSYEPLLLICEIVLVLFFTSLISSAIWSIFFKSGSDRL